MQTPPPPMCDPAEAEYVRTDGGDGCYLLTQVSVADHWQPVGVFFAVAILVCLAALVVAQIKG